MVYSGIDKPRDPKTPAKEEKNMTKIRQVGGRNTRSLHTQFHGSALRFFARRFPIGFPAQRKRDVGEDKRNENTQLRAFLSS
jgi:hypothetical protein